MFVYYTLKQYQTFFYLRCYGRRYKEGRLTKVVNEHSEQYSFELDSEGCVVTEIGFDGLTKKYLRNAAGQVVQIQRANGQVEVLEYNSAGKVETLLHLADNSIDRWYGEND